MGDALVVLVGRLRRTVFDPRPPATQLDVVLLASPVGGVGRRQVRDHQQLGTHLGADGFCGVRGLALLVAERPASGLDRSGGLLVTSALGGADFLRQALDLGAE